MEFRNLTPFPAMSFDGLDQHDRRFHTVVMRLTFEVRDDGTLAFAPVQTPLATSDEYYGEPNGSSVRQESDLAPYKPHTDVIVVADACAPKGQASTVFPVALRIDDASTAGAAARAPVLRKVLLVWGPREWRRRHPALRALGLFMLPRWRLTASTPIDSLPLRYEYAYGGENKIVVGDPAARQVPKRDRLPGRQPLSGNVESPDAIAHGVCERNPLGRGHAERWYLHAARPARIPAPQIEAPDEVAARLGKPMTPAGFGVVGRAWTPRLALAGTYDERWLEERHPRLPADFDFAYWNGAPVDQQVTPHLSGDERISLFNLCPQAQGTGRDADGNTVLSFDLPGHLPFVLVRFDDGRLGELAARLDTLIVDAAPDAGDPGKKESVVCVWRATVATEPAVRVLEARMLSRADVVALREPGRKAASRPHLAVVPDRTS